MNNYQALPENEIRKTNRELLDHHKLLLDKFLKNTLDQSRKRRVKFFKLYDLLIDEDNIRLYYFRSLRVFISALINNRLDEIKDINHTQE